MTTDVAKTTPMLTNDEELMRNITSFDDAMRVLKEANVPVVDYSTEFGDGFVLLKGKQEKATLVGVPFVILGIKFAEGDYEKDGKPREFAILHVVAQDGRKCIVIDGGTGICEDARKIVNSGVVAGVFVKNGLSRSDYDFVDEKGVKSAATTFYIAN